MKIQFYTRKDTALSPKIPMPFYVFSVGQKSLAEKEVSFSSGIKNPFVEVVWSISGIGEIIYYGKHFQMQKNDIFFFLPGEDHELRGISKEWQSRWLCIDGPFAEANFLACKFPRFQRAAHECPVELFEEIAQWINCEDPLQTGRLAGLAVMILAYARGSDLSAPNSLSARCMEFVNNNFSNPELCIEMLCDKFQVPRSTLTKIFYDDTQRPLGNYIRDVRFGNALALLRGTELSVKEIARRCGYTELTSFSRMLRRAVGISPVEIRKRSRKTPKT